MLHTINPESRAYQRRVGVLTVDLSLAFRNDDSFEDLDYAAFAAVIADDLRELGLAPDDYSVNRWIEEFGLSALADAAKEFEQIDPDDIAWSLTWRNGNAIITDGTGNRVTLAAGHTLRLAAAVVDHYAGRPVEPQTHSAV